MPSGFAFVDFENCNEAQKAYEMLNGAQVLGSQQLEVEVVKKRSGTDDMDS